jgi:hypothetical protein
MDNGTSSYVISLLNMSKKLLENRVEHQRNYQVPNLIPKCSDLFLLPIFNVALLSVENLSRDQMIILENITTLILRNMNVQEQVVIFKKCMPHIVPNILDSDFVFPLGAFVCNARPELEKELDFDRILNVFMMSNTSAKLRKSYVSKCIASIVNKFNIGTLIPNFIA